MRKIAIIVSVLLVAASIAGASSDKRIHKAVALNPNGSLSIDTHNGTVVVTTWAQPTVDVAARIEAVEFGSAEDVVKTDVRVTGSGSSVRIESDYSRVPTHLRWFGMSRHLPLIHYTISMPATARLEIEDHNASVRVSGLRNDLRVNSHNGGVQVSDFDGAASIETHNGSVRVAYSRFAKSSQFETHNGTIEVRLPPNSRFHVNANGHHMGIDSDFPTVITKGPREGRYVGDVNGGGPELRVSTHNGSLRLKKG
jgi:hypothetical protein